LRGPAADRLRASALLALGDPRGASERFRAAGDARLAERAAWVAGAWDLLRSSEDPAVRQLAEQRVEQSATVAAALPETRVGEVGPTSAALSPNNVADEAPVGRVSRARAALAEAQASRSLLATLLAAKAGP
jgi:hypothetical protein